jgi:hypothetical protein
MSEQTQQLVEGISNLLSPKQLAYTAWESAWKGNLIRFGIITALLLGACIALLTTFTVMGISNDWPRQRCSPLFMPFAELFGYDSTENFKFCITNMMQNQSSDFFAPIYAMLGDYGTSIKVVIDTINGFRKILGTFKLSVNQYFGNVAAKIQSLLFQVRLSFMKMQTLMGRVYGTFYSIIWMGSSAITAGLSLSDNSLVNFMFDFCFHPATRVRLADGSERAIADIQIGDELKGGRVTSTFRLCGRQTPMVQIGSDILSSSHMVYEGQWIPASQHSAAIPTSSIPTLLCLNVEGHAFSLASGLVVSDYDESSASSVEEAVQTMAERTVNGSCIYTKKPVYRLGFDRTCFIQMHDSTWKPAIDIRIGDRIVGNQEILGLVEEECEPVVYEGFLLGPGQLIYWNGIWVRAGTMGQATSTSNLLQFITDRTGPIAIRKDVDLWVRDYREAPLPEMEEPYQTSLGSKK